MACGWKSSPDRERSSSIAAATAANPRAASVATIARATLRQNLARVIDQARGDFRPADIHANDQLIVHLRRHHTHRQRIIREPHSFACGLVACGSVTVTGVPSA